MFDTFMTSFKLKNTYKANGIIYVLKSTPLLKKILPSNLYASAGLKTFAHIIGLILEFSSIFVGKLIYFGGIVMLSLMEIVTSPKADSFIHVFFFLSLAGLFLNTSLFDPSTDKYYSMILMRMDARKYTLSSYVYFLAKTAVGFLPFSLIFGLMSGVSVLNCLLIPFFVCGLKTVYLAVRLKFQYREGIEINQKTWNIITIVSSLFFLLLAFLPPILGFSINNLFFLLISIPVIIGSIFAFISLWKSQSYSRIYRSLLKPDSLPINAKNNSSAIMQDTYRKKLDTDLTKTSSQTGYKYFNEIFVKRHSGMLTKSAKIFTAIIAVILIVLMVLSFVKPEAKTAAQKFLLESMTMLPFIMYFINRGQNITAAMFINCDHSMLMYRFYRQPKAILLLFKERLKSITLINLMPSSVLAIGLPLLLFISGGTDNSLHYAVIFISVIALCAFFSVHNLVLYYLLQPYNAELEAKNVPYMIVNGLTYFLCYAAIGKEVPTLLFGAVVSVFCILYIIIALLLAYRLAPKTFKIK